MKGLYFLIFLFSFLRTSGQAPKELPKDWRAMLQREDSVHVIFNLHSSMKNGKLELYITNAQEKILLKDIVREGDSLNFNLPVFESSFKTKILPDGSLQGTWIKGTAARIQYWPFFAKAGEKERFSQKFGNSKANLSGRWRMMLTRPNGTTRMAIAEFEQKENKLNGTVITPNGDYRYMEGIVTGDSMFLSVFDGAHAYFFRGGINVSSNLSGYFYAGIGGRESFAAVRDANAKLPEGSSTPQLKDGESRLDFKFKDLDGNWVSINDDRFKNKVVVVQIMGSWCPNCMDETAFLSDYFKKNQSRGVEIVSLAYEYGTDFERSLKTLKKFQQLHHVSYPMLITGVGVSDSLRTEKTLPQITPIKAFPTTIFIGKDGTVKKLHTGFAGPGAKEYYEEYKRNFYATVDELLKE